MQDEVDCQNCGELIEVEICEDGACPRCGARYWWEDSFIDDDESDENTGPILMWE
jgi:hypothetical protein